MLSCDGSCPRTLFSVNESIVLVLRALAGMGKALADGCGQNNKIDNFINRQRISLKKKNAAQKSKESVPLHQNERRVNINGLKYGLQNYNEKQKLL